MSKEETKKDRERYFLKRFQELMKEEITDIRPSENPDFIAQLDGKKIGIEHTEIFQDSHLGKGSQLKKRQAIRKKLGDTIVCELEKVIRIPFQLSIRFSYHYELGNNQVQETALRIIKAVFEESDIFLQKHELIIEAMEGFKDRLLKDWHNKHIKTEPTIEELNAYRLLPKEIDRIRLSHFKKQTFSYYSENEGGSVSDLTDTHLLYVIREKEKKLLKYKNCDEYWLLITEGNFHAGSFDNITASKIDKTSFDRIFLLREGKNELITLF